MQTALQVVIVGGGTAGWMTAAAMARLLDPQRYAVTLIESDDIGTVGVGEATLPHIRAYNAMLGLNEAEFMRATRATFKLGIEFRGWGRHAYIHPFGAFGEPLNGVDFHQHWVRAKLADEPVEPFQTYSYAVMAARAGRFDFPNEDPKSIRSTYAYAYHFDAGLYANFLRDFATRLGVKRIEGQVVDVTADPNSGHVESVLLKSGQRIGGRLFVDCSGFRSLLLGNVMKSGWEDWTPWLPCDRAFAVPTQNAGDFTPYTRATAQTAGWTWRIPLQHRTGNGYVFSSCHISEDQARDTLLGAVDGKPLAEPKLLRFQAGRRTQSWAGNVVGIGLASGFLEPLESTSIYLIQAAVSALCELMPATAAIDPRLAAAFNAQIDAQYERVRDFLILHYHVNARHGQPLWDEVRAMPIPDSLTQRLELFRRRGHIPFYRDGLFSKESWLSVLFGQDLMPEGYDRLADALPRDAAARLMADFHGRIAGQIDVLPTHEALIARFCAAKAVAA